MSSNGVARYQCDGERHGKLSLVSLQNMTLIAFTRMTDVLMTNRPPRFVPLSFLSFVDLEFAYY